MFQVRIYLLQLLILPVFSIFGQGLSGRVVDEDSNEPLAGANIFLKSDWRKGTGTDKNGEFVLQGVASSDTLVISFIGYQEKQLPVQITEQNIIIYLKPKPSELEELIVTAEKPVAEEFSYTKISKLGVYTNPGAKADPLLAVNSLPSSTTLDESANISFRGSSPAETGIYFNNVPVYDAVRFSQRNGIGNFSVFNTAILEDIYVFPGNPPLEYGNTTSGLISIQTSEEIFKENTNSATVSLASIGLLTNRSVSENSGLTVFVNHQLSPLIRGINYQALEAVKSFSSIDLGINFIAKLTENSRLKIFNYSLSEGYEYQYSAPTFDGSFHQAKKRNLTVANWRNKMGQSEVTINSGLSFSEADYRFAESDIKITSNDLFLSFNYQYTGATFNIKTGISDDYRNQGFAGSYYIYEYALGEGFPLSFAEAKAQIHRPEIFLYGKKYFTDKWILGGGIRKNIPSGDQENYLSKQLSSLFQISDNFSITTGWGQFHKYHLGQDQYSTAHLIKSDHVSIDLEYSTGSFALTGALFAKKTEQHNQSTDILGGEIFVEGALIKNLEGQISFTYLNAETTSENGPPYPDEYDLNYFIRGHLKYRLDSYWSFTGSFIFRAGKFYQPLESVTYNNGLEIYVPQYLPISQPERLPDYKLIDIGVTRLIPICEKLNMIAFGAVNNLVNNKNISNYSYNFDYSNRKEELYSLRAVYFGVLLNF